MESEREIENVLRRYLDNECTREEMLRLLEWNNAHPDFEWYTFMSSVFDCTMPDAGFTKEKWEPVLRSILGEAKAGKIRKIGAVTKWRVAVAACTILLLGAFMWWIYNWNGLDNKPAKRVVNFDIPAPVTNRAMITLADGSKVYLDSTGNGQLAQQGTIKLIKLANGQIAYQTANGQIIKEPQYNTLTNPKGSRVIDMVLSDGSHVWLNAGSSITYPVAFTGNERKVELKGEGYFEVAKLSPAGGGARRAGVDKRWPFWVIANGTATEVLGTHFNVNAYGDEQDTRVTLLEGRVKVSGIRRGASGILKPGQQAVVNLSTYQLVNHPNLDQVMAWKNGYFSFDGLTLKQAMTQLERWYDIDVVYESGVADVALEGKMTRDIPLQGLMTVLQKLGVHCQLTDRKLIIKK